MAANQQLGAWERPAVPETVPELRKLLAAAIDGWGFDEFEVALATTEALSNVVQHAYPREEGALTLMATLAGDELVVAVADQGMGARSFRLESRPYGVGLQLMANLSVRMSVEPVSDGTTVTMWFLRKFP